MSNSRMPAAPIVNQYGQPQMLGDVNFDKATIGLTKREAFAMAAMQGLCSNGSRGGPPGELAEVSVNIADALLKELAE